MIFGWGYKEDALKWRDQEKWKREQYLSVRKQCTVYMTLISGEVVKYINEAKNSADRYEMNGELVLISADSHLRDTFLNDGRIAAKSGITVENKHYMPSCITGLEMGEITDIKNEATE